MRVSDILLDTKIRIPPLRSNLVNRLHLIQKLNDGIDQGCCLTLISAPAGYGKSTLLSEWVSQVGIPTAWLSLEKGENNPIRFWSYFLAALSSIPHMRNAGIGESLTQSLHLSKPPLIDGLLAELVNDIARLDQSAILVLDDLHTILDGQIHQDLIFLIDHLPRSSYSLHLVVASRMDPPWPLARWRVRGELNELRPADLRFSVDETLQFLDQTLQLRLSTQDIHALQARTEGWIAGLQMAVISIMGRSSSQGSEGVSHFIQSLSGSNRFMVDYLMEEVISQQTSEVQDFLFKTSILQRLTAPLCDALFGRQDSQAILKQVEQANLFLIPLDDERQWYRYHHLFAELLRKRLKQRLPDQITELHRCASKWYAENGVISEAISHALDSGDIQRVNELVSGNVLAMLEHFELLDVLRHFEKVPDKQMIAKPWLCVAYAWVKAYTDPSEGLDRILQQAETGLVGVQDDLERRHLSCHLDAIRAYVAWIQGKAVRALQYAHRAMENLPENDWMTHAHLLNTEGVALQYLDYLPEAAKSFETAILAGQRSGRLQETFFAFTSLSFIYYLQGRLRQTFSLCQHVLSLAQTHFPHDEFGQVLSRMPILAHAYANMSQVQIDWNDIEGALLSARQGVALAEQWKQADALHYSLTCLSKALCAAGELEEAFTINKRAMQLAVNVSTWFVRLSIYNEVWLNLVKGDIPSAVNLFPQVESLIEEELKHGGTYLIMKVSLLDAQQNYPGVLAALEGLMAGFAQTGKDWTLINLLPFQALALQALGREEEALKVIGHCLALAESEGFVRIFVDRGGPMFRLLQIALSRGIETEYIRKLLPAFTIIDSTPQSEISTAIKVQPSIQNARLVEPLSERELQVLRLLDSALTSEEIGRELFVSVNTIRTHIRNIYAKLGVNRRGDAVQRAQELNLM
jgi:LuxR family transcriptional regulator, maltose regulon positive regulatory protein